MEELSSRQSASQHKDNWRSRVRRFFYAGALEKGFSENTRRILIINLFSCVGFIFTFPLGIHALILSKFHLAAALICIGVLFFLNLIYLRRTHNHVVSGSIIIYPLYSLMLYLVFAGGVGGTGYIWIFCVPSVSLFIQGMKRGLIEVGVFTLLLTLIIYVFTETFSSGFQYEEDMKFRIIASFLVVVFLSSIYEYSMTRFNQELRETTNKLKVIADTDLLTGLLNRRGIQRKLERLSVGNFFLLLADVDYFKKINDVYGHDAGDFILSEFSRLATNTLPEGCLCSRWGGEEFLFAVNKNSAAEAISIAEKMRQVIEQHEFEYEGQTIRITSSFGVVALNGQSPLKMALKIADKRLYQAKAQGRNRVCFTG